MTTSEQEQFQALITDCQSLGLELFTLSDVKKAFNNIIPKLVSSLGDTTRLMTRWDYSRPEVLSVSSLRLKAKQLNYLEMDDITVPVPVGFQGRLTKYLEHCRDSTYQEMKVLKETTLPRITDYLAKYVNEPELLNERFVPMLGDKDIGLVNSLASSEGTYFIAGNRVSDRSYTDVFESNTDMVNAAIILNDINTSRWDKANPKDIKRQVTSLTAIATTLLNTIQSMETPPNSEHIAGISIALESAARWVEWYSVSVARLLETTASMKRMEKKLLRL